MKRRQMAAPSRSKSGSRPAHPPNRMAKSGKTAPPFNVRRTIFSFLLWGLGIVNVVIIALSVWNRFAIGNEHAISSDTIVAAEPTTAFKIEVRNGCGVDGLARKVADYLKKQGYDPVTIDNFERRDIPRTMVLDRLSNAAVNAHKVAQVLGLSDDYVAPAVSPELMVGVTVIIGQDYKVIQIPSK